MNFLFMSLFVMWLGPLVGLFLALRGHFFPKINNLPALLSFPRAPFAEPQHRPVSTGTSFHMPMHVKDANPSDNFSKKHADRFQNARAAGLVPLDHEGGGNTIRRALSRLELGSQRAVSRAGAVSRMAVRAASRAASRADDLLEPDDIVWTQSSKPSRRLQIAILGASGSGKTAMIQYAFHPVIPAATVC